MRDIKLNLVAAVLATTLNKAVATAIVQIISNNEDDVDD
jgi:hypothetical protein